MSNLKVDLLRAANGEKIEAVVVGCAPDDLDGWDQTYPPMSWDEAAPLLDYEFDSGFGCVECHAVYAWTASLVLFVTNYDGHTYVNFIPRNPQDCTPHMPGGG